MHTITLRPWAIEDASSLQRHANNKAIANFMTDSFPHPYTLENAIAFIEFANAKNPTHIFAIDLKGEPIGGIGLHPKQDIERMNAELGYWIAESYWGKGYMTEAIQKIIPIGFSIFPIHRIYARPFGSNKASQKVLEKCGFTLEAKISSSLLKNNVVEDELIYAIRKTAIPQTD